MFSAASAASLQFAVSDSAVEVFVRNDEPTDANLCNCIDHSYMRTFDASTAEADADVEALRRQETRCQRLN